MPLQGELWERLYWDVGRFFQTPHDRPPKYMLMITVYLDESEQSSVSKYMAVAGFFGNEQQWDSFLPDWKVALGKKKALHMNTLRINSKPDRAKKLLDKLGPLPRKHGLRPVCSIVKMADYADLVQDSSGAAKALHGYNLCLSAIIEALNKIIPCNESIKIVCEAQKEHAEQAYRMFRAMTMKLAHPAKPYFAGIEFIPKHSSVLTQPADFLAFAVTHWHQDSDSVTSKLCLPILDKDKKTYGYRLSRGFVRQAVSGAKAHMRIRGARW